METAANLVQEAAHPEANIIFGATFDEGLEDEIRVTVIATGFDENQSIPFPHQQQEEQPAPVKEPVPAAAQPAAAAEQPAPSPEPEQPKPTVNDDDWDILERIFSKKR